MRRKKNSSADASLWLPGFGPGDQATEQNVPAAKAHVEIASPVEVPPRSALLQEVIPASLTVSVEDGAPEPCSLFADSEIVVEPVEAKNADKPVWSFLESTAHVALGGEVVKFEANLAALGVLRTLEQEQRTPDEDERRALNRYTGWGALPQAFNLEQTSEAWERRAAALQQVLGDDYEAVRSSVVNAHYTELHVIDAMWAAVERFGFKGGRVIEPSAGAGFFVGRMPTALAKASEITALEIEPLSARIVTALYGSFGVKTQAIGFEKARLPENWYDLVISNIPFGNYPVPDDRHVPFAKFLIHDYFFGRALEIARPGGLIAFITSAGTLDKYGDGVRRYITTQARLLGAIRLPSGTFSHIANTDVTTDIVFLQKLYKGETAAGEWTELAEAPASICDSYEKIWISRWYVDHPEMLIGRMERRSNGYTKANAAVFEGDVRSELTARVALLPREVYAPRTENAAKAKPREIRVAAPSYIKPGAYCLTEERMLAMSEGEELLVIEDQVSGKVGQRIRGMIAVRDAARRLLHAQCMSSDDSELRFHQNSLNGAYDRFVSKHGWLHSPANRSAFRTDPDYPLLLSLEHFDPEKNKAQKADIFFRRTVGAARKIEHCDTVEEALMVSLHERGCVDTGFMGSLLNKSRMQFVPQMAEQGLIFRNPQSGEWEEADAYLSGNVRRKLEQAQAAGEGYERNVMALQAVIPADLGPGDIDARVGSTWIPARDYAAFLDFILDCKGCDVQFSAKAGAWNVDIPYVGRESVAAAQTYGTGRMAAGELFVVTLNQSVPTIKDYDEVHDRYVVNKEETIAIREKQQALKDAFRAWGFADPDRCARLVRLYNDQFNGIRLRAFDGSRLSLPGFSQVFELHRHQRDAVWRIVAGGLNTLLAHVVGAGKTLSMICAGMEMRRLGMVNKPCYVVPNHMLEQFTAEFLRAYPAANILMASKDDLVGDKRRTLLSRVATGDWDAVLITHASYERIRMSDAAMRRFIEQELQEIIAALEASKKGRGNRIVKELERAKKVWEARLERFSAREKKDDVLTFEELGIDFLFIDEAHYFKNLYRFTKMTRVAGLPNSNSERAFDMFVKTRCVMDQHDGRWGVVFATGTPVSNTMAELWTMQRYLQPGTLAEHLIQQFDAWAGNFGEAVTALELSPDGGGYRMNTRFARFVNIPELMTMFREVADIRTAQMLKLPVPKHRMETIIAKPTEELKALVKELVARAEVIRNGKVHPKEDNMLAVTNDGRRAALDLRLVKRGSLEASDGKTALCTERVFDIWQRTSTFRGTQAVFCDLSTPAGDGRFSVYQDLRAKLIEKGIPTEEIAFVHDYESDAAKAELFKSVREGRIRVAMGSTQKMGVGTNIQTRLIALHHLDAPWRPADVEQREGRIVRQGNTNEEVWIYRYVTAGSFDAYIWQILETKARFIAQIMSGDTGIRSAEDVELAALSYAEVKALASGNPLVMEKAGVDAEVAKLSLLKSQWDNLRWGNQREAKQLPEYIERTRKRVGEIEADLGERLDVRGNRFAIEINGKTYTERVPAGELLLHYYGHAADHGNSLGAWARAEERPIGRFAGLKLAVAIAPPQAPYFSLKNRQAYAASHSDSAQGIVRVIENAAAGMSEALVKANEKLARDEKRLADILLSLDRPFEKAERLAELIARQREINSALDLDKNAAGAMDAEAEAA